MAEAKAQQQSSCEARTRLLPVAIAGLGGALLIYLLDPAGRGRRARQKDQSLAAVRRGSRRIARFGRHIGAQAGGFWSRASHAGRPDNPEPDEVTLTNRVESELFRDPDVPKGQININVEHGAVVLRGALESVDQIAAIEAKTRRIEGVRTVTNLMHVAGTPAPNKAAARRASHEAGAPTAQRQPPRYD